MNLILKKRHRRLSWLSGLGLLPALVTIISFGLVQILNLGLARQIITFFLNLSNITLFIIWLVLPVFSYVTATKAERYGTIHRLRNVNAWTRRLASVVLLLITLVATASFFALI